MYTYMHVRVCAHTHTHKSTYKHTLTCTYRSTHTHTLEVKSIGMNMRRICVHDEMYSYV